MGNILEVNGLTKRYKDFSLDNISFNLSKGYIMGFIGPNGAGKSTTIKLIMNLIKRDSGEIKVFGLDNLKDEQAVKERIGFVYDENHFYDELTVLETKRIIAPFYKNWDDRQFADYLDKFDLPGKRKVKDLSKGMKMKLSVAIALSHNAELIVMDEPTAGLDPIMRNEMLEILRGLIQDENKGVLLSTHITTDLDKVADYITFINRGRLVFSSSKEDLMEKYAVVKGDTATLDSQLRKELVGIRENQFGFEALTKDVQKVRKLIGDSVLIERATLEDIMLYSVKGGV